MKSNFYVMECDVYSDLTVYSLEGAKGRQIARVDSWEALRLMMPDVPWYSPLGRIDVPSRIAAYGSRQEVSP